MSAPRGGISGRISLPYYRLSSARTTLAHSFGPSRPSVLIPFICGLMDPMANDCESAMPLFETGISNRRRVLSIAMMIAYTLLGPIIVITEFVLVSFEDGPIAWGVILVGVSLTAIGVLGLRWFYKADWLGQRYIVYKDRIEKVSSSGRVETGHWRRVCFASSHLTSLGFDDGTYMATPLFWQNLSADQVSTVLGLADRHGPIERAWIEHAKTEYLKFTGSGARFALLGFLTCIMGGTAFLLIQVMHSWSGALKTALQYSTLYLAAAGALLVFVSVMSRLIRATIDQLAEKKRFQRMSRSVK